MLGVISKFVDLEATVDKSEDESSEYETDDFEFVEEDGDEDKPSQVYRWSNPEDDASPQILQKLAEDIQSRARSARKVHSQDVPEGFIYFLPSADDIVWRVKVKSGLERDIVLAIIQKTILGGSTSHGILSAFSRDSLHGSIYVEARSLHAVTAVLQGISGVARTSGNRSFIINVVDIQDRPVLLDMKLHGLRSGIKPSSWVRIKGGIYKGDLALVSGVDMSLLCEVYVVPRLALGAKRKRERRPPPALFDAQLVESTFRSKVESRNKFQLFQGKLYYLGLCVTTFHMSMLTNEGVNATAEELQHFQQLPEWNTARQFISPIKVGDRARVVSGAFKGGWGVTSEIKESSIALSWENNQKDVREVLIRDIRKFFQLGDFVHILHGPNRGDQGFVVHLEDKLVIIYKQHTTDHRVSGEQSNLSGYEVTADVSDVDWQSTPVDLPSAHQITPIEPHTVIPGPPRDKVLEPLQAQHNRYKHMDVRIVQGALKGNFARIIGTHWVKTIQDNGGHNEYEEVADVETETQAVKSHPTYRLCDLRERHSGLKLERALWIPKQLRKPPPEPPTMARPSTARPSTPEQSGCDHDELSNHELEPAWDATSHLPSQNVETILNAPLTDCPIPGTWLLDPRLMFKKIDVRIRGTFSPLWYNGRYEDQLGFTVVTQTLHTVESPIIIKLGYEEKRLSFQPRYLVPVTTTEDSVPLSIQSTRQPTSITSAVGTRVLVIGPDSNGLSDYIGQYAVVIRCQWPLEPEYACTHIATTGPFWGTCVYFHVDSLCRSHTEDGRTINWPGPNQWVVI